MIVRARAPLRLGLAGGGTDVSPYCDLHGGLVLNATIDKYAYTVIEPRGESDRVRFVAADNQAVWEDEATPRVELDGQLMPDHTVPLSDDRKTHKVHVQLG